MTGLIPIRNRLAYPAGVAPGFNPSHPAAKNILTSYVASGGGVNSLITGKNATYIGTNTKTIDSVVGPSFWSNNANKFIITGNTHQKTGNVSGEACTFAAIFPACVDAQYLVGNSFYFNANVAGAIYFEAISQNSVSTTATSVAGDPYFIVATMVHNGGPGAQKILMKNLRTGKVIIEEFATSFFFASNTSPTTDYSVATGTGGYVSAFMAADCFMSKADLLRWAEDPWGFWYPDSIGMQATAPARSRTPVFDTVRRVFPV